MISVFGSWITDIEIQSVVECMNNQWLGYGNKVPEFEKEFMKKFNVDNFIMVDSGSNALFMAVSLLDLPKGSKIALPSFTWISCAQAIILAGHVPVFCDVDINTMNIRREDIDECLKKHSDIKAIMIVHYAGLSVDMDLLIELGMPIIEDAAHAVCSTYKGISCGNISDIGIYSFDAVKNLTSGEGGGLCVKNPSLLGKAKAMRYCGIGKSGFEAAASSDKKNRWWEYNIQECFIKMLPTNISASIALAQLARIDELQAIRYKIWKCYQETFSKLEWIKTPEEENPGDFHSYFTYCIRIPKRDELASFLFDNGVYTTLRYHPLHLNSIYNQTHIRLPNCEQLNEDCLSIPLHPRLTNNDVDKIMDLIREFGKKNSL